MAPVRIVASGGAKEAELRQGRHAVVETDFLRDPAVFDTEHGRSGEAHLAAGGRRQRAHEKVIERGTGVRATADPATDDVIALGDEVGGPTESEIGEGLAAPGNIRLRPRIPIPGRLYLANPPPTLAKDFIQRLPGGT
jgi:hypothetical protein